MSMKQKIFKALVVEGKQKTAAQLAAQLGTTEGTVAARISEIRSAGFPIYANKRTDSAGRTKTFYRHGSPTRAVVSLGTQVARMIG